jgi:hypothetical protein
LKLAIEPDSQSASHWFDEIVTFQGDAVLAFSPGLMQRLDLEKSGASRATELPARWGSTGSSSLN